MGVVGVSVYLSYMYSAILFMNTGWRGLAAPGVYKEVIGDRRGRDTEGRELPIPPARQMLITTIRTVQLTLVCKAE